MKPHDLGKVAGLFTIVVACAGNGEPKTPADDMGSPAGAAGVPDAPGASSVSASGADGASGIDGASGAAGAVAAGPVGGAADAGAPGAPGAAGAATGGTGGKPTTAMGVRWIGRVDASDPAAVKFAWSGTGFVGLFAGPRVSVKLKTQGGATVFFQPVVDGTPGKRFSVGSSEQVVELASSLGAGQHRIELYRETEGKGFGYSVFSGFAQGKPSAPPAAPGRLIEVIGDSISAGYGNLGSEQHPGYGPDPQGGCHFSTDTESAYQAYGAATGRAVNADVSVLAGSGWGIYSDNSGNQQNVMSALFGNTLGDQKAPAWSFAAQPQAVVINLGTNDSTAHNLTPDKFKPAYAAFLATVRAKYPKAFVLCAVGSLLGGAEHTNAVQYLQELVKDRAAKGDTKLKVLDLGTQDPLQGTGCDWHPNAVEDKRMAGLLAKELNAVLGW